MPRRTSPTSIVLPASVRMATTTSFRNIVATSLTKASECQRYPRTPAVIEPPETLEMRNSFGRYASSRYPPPDRHNAMPGAGAAGVSVGIVRTGEEGLLISSESGTELVLAVPQIIPYGISAPAAGQRDRARDCHRRGVGSRSR